MATVGEVSADRSISVGRVFERAFTTIRHNPAVTFGLAFLFGLIPTLLTTYLIARSPAEMAGGGVTMFALVLINWGISIVIAALTQAALTKATVAEAEGRRAGFREGLGAALAVIGPLIFLALLIGISVMIGLALLIVPGAILYVMWAVATPALVEERRGVFASLGRSRALTKGVRWRVFAILLVLLVIYWLATAAVGVAGLATAESFDPNAGWSAGVIVSSAVLGLLLNLLWGLVQASLYVELRNAKDGPAPERLEEVFA